MKNYEFNITEENTLLEFLLVNVNDSKNNVKSFLKNGYVTINGEIVTKHDYPIHVGDKVVLKVLHGDLEVLYEDDELLIVNKEAGLLTIGTETEREHTLYRRVSAYVKTKNKDNKVFIVNRLDRDTSGIVVFAKSEKTKSYLQINWNDLVKRRYVAVVVGLTEKRDSIKSYLNENSEYMVFSDKVGKLALTEYERIKYNSKYSMLNVYLKTGRKNQIRVHMKEINHPIVGDKKYGVKGPRLMLHCAEVEFRYKGKLINVKSDYDPLFDEYLRLV